MKKYKYSWINGVIVISILLPIFLLLLWSVSTRWPWPELFPHSFSWRGISDLWRQNYEFTRILLSSMFISIAAALLSVLISLATSRAYILLQSKGLQRLVYQTLSLPFVIPAVVFGMGIHQLMIQWGLNNTAFGVILVHLVYSLPYATYLILDACQSIGLKLEEQARLLGATAFQAFRLVTLPLLLPVMATAFSMSYIVSFSQYFLTALIGGGQVKTFTIVMFPYLQNNDRPIASSYALVFLIFTFLVFLIFEAVSKFLQRKYQAAYYY